jgi:hypothetical protein
MHAESPVQGYCLQLESCRIVGEHPGAPQPRITAWCVRSGTLMVSCISANRWSSVDTPLRLDLRDTLALLLRGELCAGTKGRTFFSVSCNSQLSLAAIVEVWRPHACISTAATRRRRHKCIQRPAGQCLCVSV